MKKPEPILLGIETGGTKTVVIAADTSFRLLARHELGPANLRLVSDRDFLALLAEIKSKVPKPAAVGIGLPGMRTVGDARRVLDLLDKTWPGVPAKASNDLTLVIHAVELDEPRSRYLAKVVVLSGTGSCCFGASADGPISEVKARSGRSKKVGGWGHILGDRGSGYDIAVRGCRTAVYHYDRDNEWTALGESILRQLSLNEPEELINWIQAADKKEVASVAVAVFEAWKKKDQHAAEIVESAAHSLAADALKCATRLENSDAVVQFILAGSVLLKQPRFSELVAETIRQKRPQSVVAPIQREAAWGAVHMASSLPGVEAIRPQFPFLEDQSLVTSTSPSVGLEKSPTELRNPRSVNLDKLSSRKAINLFISEERYVHRALQEAAPRIERALNLITQSFKRGGRLFYVGAGTSGRLGILDASECPPTFRTDPEMVQGIIAGGQPAVFRAAEGAEDDAAAGGNSIAFRNVTARDVVVGIAASGRTPFVWGALEGARKRRAKTILLTFNPNLQIPRSPKLDLLLAVDVGPELLTGSTRLKSGTATKLILNMLTTLAMVRLGKVASNLMIDLNPSNIKLRDRAVRIVQQITDSTRDDAEQALRDSGWIVKTAIKVLQRPKRSRSKR